MFAENRMRLIHLSRNALTVEINTSGGQTVEWVRQSDKDGLVVQNTAQMFR